VHKPEAAGQPEGDAGDGPLRLAIPKFTTMMLPTVATRHKQHGHWQRAAGTSLVAGAGRAGKPGHPGRQGAGQDAGVLPFSRFLASRPRDFGHEAGFLQYPQ
jgi:hypothetical protein